MTMATSKTGTVSSSRRSPSPSATAGAGSTGPRCMLQTTPSSVLANQSQNIPAPECCCFSARFVNLILFLFNFIFLLSGICILLLTLLYGRPEVSRYLGETTKYLNNIISLLGNGHLVQIIHYSMLFCGIVIIIISLLNIIFFTATSWSRSSDFYYYHRRKRANLTENEALLHYNSGGNGNNGSIFDSSIDRRHNSSSTGYLNQTNEQNLSRTGSLGLNDSSKHDSPSSNSLQNGHRHNRSINSSSTGSSSDDKQPQAELILLDDQQKSNKKQNHQKQLQRQQTAEHNSTWSHFANSPFVLCCYIFILLFLFTVQLVIGLLSVLTVSPEHVFISSRTIHNDDFLVSVRESVDYRELLVNHGQEIEPLYPVFHCCGWNAFDDYEFIDEPDHRNKTIPVPDACCKTLVKNCGRRKHPNNIYYDGCWSKFGAEMRDYVLLLGWTALGFAVIELIGLMFAVCHYVQIISKANHQLA